MNPSSLCFCDKGEMAGSHGGPSETLAGLLPQEVWAAGECTHWKRAWGSLLKSVKPQHGSHSLGSVSISNPDPPGVWNSDAWGNTSLLV